MHSKDFKTGDRIIYSSTSYRRFVIGVVIAANKYGITYILPNGLKYIVHNRLAYMQLASATEIAEERLFGRIHSREN